MSSPQEKIQPPQHVIVETPSGTTIIYRGLIEQPPVVPKFDLRLACDFPKKERKKVEIK